MQLISSSLNLICGLKHFFFGILFCAASTVRDRRVYNLQKLVSSYTFLALSNSSNVENVANVASCEGGVVEPEGGC